MGPALTLDVLLGEIEGAHGRRWGLRLAVEAWKEPHRGHTALGRFLPPADRRLYLRGEPYVLLPQVTMSIVLLGSREQDGSIGRLAGPPLLEGLLHHKVGSCQAWAVPSLGVALIWEAYLFGPWRRSPDPREDRGAQLLWRGWEEAICRMLPGTRELRTPPREPVYENGAYREFLAGMGYRPAGDAPYWRKEVGTMDEGPERCPCADPTCSGGCACRACAGSGAAGRRSGLFCPRCSIELRGPEGTCPRCKEGW
jgi:hypothetical protein